MSFQYNQADGCYYPMKAEDATWLGACEGAIITEMDLPSGATITAQPGQALKILGYRNGGVKHGKIQIIERPNWNGKHD